VTDWIRCESFEGSGPVCPMLYEARCLSRGFWPRLRNILAVWNQHADIYHVTGDIHYVCCVLPKRRTVLTVHDCEILHRLNGWKRAIVHFLWYILPTRYVTRITVNSEETKRQLLRAVTFPPDRIHVIPVSVSPLYQPSPRPFNSEFPRILQVGTKANKNVPRLVQALRGLPCHLDIVGPVDATLRQLLQDCQIVWTGWERLTDEQLAERYREADIIAFVSTHEGFGMPIVEAQSVERVCITSNCSSMPEVAGTAACLVNPFDVESIRTGVLRLLSDRVYRETLVAAGRKNRVRYDAKTIAKQFACIYEHVANQM